MMKLQLIYLTLWSISDAAYMSRMAMINHNNQMNRVRPTAFRPGVMLRPWNPRLVQAASHRVPYVVYRNHPNRYSVKHYTPTRVFSSPWKATRLPSSLPTSTEYEFVRAASAPVTHTHTEGGAIHTIPAPNLSLSEKPIVVLEGNSQNHGPSSETPKVYEVTEKYPDQSLTQIPAKIEQPIGFSKATSFTTPELHSLVRNGAALQLASDLGLSAISLPQSSLPQSILSQQTIVPQANLQHHSVGANILAQSILPQQFALQSFNNLPNPHDMIQAGPEGIVISPSALYQPDPAFLQKLQNQLLQRFPGVEFVPYAADIQQVPSQNIQVHNFHAPVQNQNAQQSINHPVTVPPQNQQQTPLFLLQNEQFTRQVPSSFVTAESQNLRSVVQRETQEGTVVTLVPQVSVTNVTQKDIEVTSVSTPQNITVELVAAESRPESSTVKYIIETTTEEQKTTPVFITHVDNQGNLVPVGFTVQNSGNNGPTGQNFNAVTVPQNVAVTGTEPVTQNVNNNGAASQNVINSPPPQQFGYNGPYVQNATFGSATQNSGLVPQSITPSGFNIGNLQVGQNGGNVVTDGFYSAINNVRAAAALVQVENPQQQANTQENNTTTAIPTSTINADLKAFFVQQTEPNTQNKSLDIKHSLGVPFAKTQNSVNVAYTLHRTDEKDAKVAKDGSVYAGQIVEASVSEDTDFNKQKANLLSRRAPIRLVAVPENQESTTTTTVRVPAKVVVKAKFPPKSKLTYDDKTGEPVLRIYASYVDNPAQVNATSTEKDYLVLQKPSLELTATSNVYPTNDLQAEDFTTSKDLLLTSGVPSSTPKDYLSTSIELFFTPTDVHSTSERPSPVYIPFTSNDVLTTPDTLSSTLDDLSSSSNSSTSVL